MILRQKVKTLSFCQNRRLRAAAYLTFLPDFLRQGRGAKARLGPPAPVAPQTAGGVQVRLGPKAQPVVHGDDGPLGRGGQSRPDQRLARGGGLDRLHLGGGGLHRRGHVQVGGGGLLLLGRGGVLPPVGQGGVVGGVGISTAVLGVVVWTV